ncbi:ashwin [Gasterosteus aculeatus]|uniref:ashwin n=1 Tax=Gasterosteus aculeatus aculeatus TaxID=481459 RepID=UPI001A99149E|nr:ashwin [Gasterosteus aculeatus aculeatus]
MATPTERDGKAVCSSAVDLLLHPELLSHDFLQLILREKHVSTGERETRDRLTELYLRHVIPLPQRTLPDSRWGKRMEAIRGQRAAAGHTSHSSRNDHNRKRPPIVFDGSSSHSGPLKVKKTEGTSLSTGTIDRLKPPPASNLFNPVCKLSGNTPSSSIHCTPDTANLQREANNSGSLTSPEVKKKIQHVTWP